MEGRDYRHSAHSYSVGPDDPTVLGAPWPYNAGAPILAAPALSAADDLYFGTEAGDVHRVALNGRGTSIYSAGAAIGVTPALVGLPADGEGAAQTPDAVYAASDDGFLHAIAVDGSPLWRMAPGSPPCTGPIRSSPTAWRENPVTPLSRIYVGADDGRLFAVFEVDPFQAVNAWEVGTGAPVRISPALSLQSDIVYLGSANGSLLCLDAFTGTHLPGSPVPLSAAALSAPLVAPSGNVYVADAAGTVFARTRTGQALWQQQLGGAITAAPVWGRGEVLVVAGQRLLAFSETGVQQWDEPLPIHPDTLAAADAAGTTYLTTPTGAVLGVRRDLTGTGTRIAWQVTLQPAGTHPTAVSFDAHGRLFVGGDSGLLYAIDDEPAFQLLTEADEASATTTDVYSLRETYGALDPSRTIRLTDDPKRDGEPTYSLDRGVMAFVSERAGSADAFLATAMGTLEENLTSTLPPGSRENDPAFTPINDLTGDPRPPHGLPYLAFTSRQSGQSRLYFLDLDRHANGAIVVKGFTDWAASIGVPSPLASTLEPQGTDQSHVAFSPNGRKVAWRHCDPSTGLGTIRLLAAGPAGWSLGGVGPPYPLNPEDAQPCRDEPCFSPDSRWVAVREAVSLSIHDTTGVGASVYSTPPIPGAVPSHPNWSPDGSEIAVGLRDGATTRLFILSGSGFAAYKDLGIRSQGDQPYYHYFKMPTPRALRLQPDRQEPGATIEIHGRGFDILHPEHNAVSFTETTRGPRLPAPVLSAHVDPTTGLGVLTVRVPDLAGHGPVTVETRFGTSTTPVDLRVLPRPSRLDRRRTVPGARIRVFGRGFDLSPATQHTVHFGAAAGGEVSAPAISGSVSGTEEFLVVQVPAGVADPASVRVENPYGSNLATQQLSLLQPTVSLLRTVSTGPTTGLPSYASQGATGVPVTVTGSGFPFDPFFGYGVTFASLEADVSPALQTTPPTPAVQIRTVAFATPGPDTVSLVAQTFTFPSLGQLHPGGMLTISAVDASLRAAQARTTFQVPETDIPIIFVPGTSGASLDIAPGVFAPITATMPLHTHTFPWLSQTALPGEPWGPLVHLPRGFTYNPAVPATYLPPGPILSHPGDPLGRRIWAGPEAIAEMVNTTLPPAGNVGNHYLDICGFNAAGTPLRPQVAAGTVLQDVMLVFGPNGWIHKEQYKPMVDFLQQPKPSPNGWKGRPVCAGAVPTGPCLNAQGQAVSGHNAVYLFNLDWRQSIPVEAARLSAFIDAVLARPDVVAAKKRKVAIITHSYGGPVARGYYLDPAFGAAAKVDQVISLGGGFLGVPQPMDILEQGGTWGLGYTFGAYGIGIQPWETKSLARNWPTAYFQMPNSEGWFADHGTPISGGAVDRSFVHDHRGWPYVPAGALTTYAASMAWVGARHNATLATAQTTYFGPTGPLSAPIGDFRTGTGSIYHHRVISKGRMDTIVGTAVTSGPSLAAAFMLPTVDPRWYVEMVPTEHWASVYGDGDSTVPYHGALGLTDTRDDRVYILNGVVHGDMPNEPPLIGQGVVKGLLQLLLEGAIGSVAKAPSPFLSQNQVLEIRGPGVPPPLPLAEPTPLAARPAEPAAAPEPDRWLVELRGLARLDVTDADGRHLGPDPEHPYLLEEDIPGASYRAGPPISTAFLQRGSYVVRVTALATTNASLNIRPYDAAGMFSTMLFRSVALDEGQVAELKLDAATGRRAPAVLGVRPEDGAGAREVGADILRPAQAMDIAPPTTTATIRDGLVRLAADDGDTGSGVYQTRYTTDGSTFEVYEGPFRLPGDARLLMAHSEDWAGNLEYPGAVLPALGLSETEVTLRPDASGHALAEVRVENLDPIGISPSLDWEAEAGCDWLRLRPASGGTPETLTILADATGLAPGQHACDIVVRTTAPGALFSERVLPVVVVVEPVTADRRAVGAAKQPSRGPADDAADEPADEPARRPQKARRTRKKPV
jgi:outer membrane protein assembly factor BamB